MSPYLRNLAIVGRIPTALTPIGKPCLSVEAHSRAAQQSGPGDEEASVPVHAIPASLPTKQEPSLKLLRLRQLSYRKRVPYPWEPQKDCRGSPRFLRDFARRVYGMTGSKISFYRMMDSIGIIDKDTPVEVHQFYKSKYLRTLQIWRTRGMTLVKKTPEVHTQWLRVRAYEDIDWVVDTAVMGLSSWLPYEGPEWLEATLSTQSQAIWQCVQDMKRCRRWLRTQSLRVRHEPLSIALAINYVRLREYRDVEKMYDELLEKEEGQSQDQLQDQPQDTSPNPLQDQTKGKAQDKAQDKAQA